MGLAAASHLAMWIWDWLEDSPSTPNSKSCQRLGKSEVPPLAKITPHPLAEMYPLEPQQVLSGKGLRHVDGH